jgi:hypothetical protein
MFKKTMLIAGFAVLCFCSLQAKPTPVAWSSGMTIEPGKWYDAKALEAAKARATELGVPLLVYWGRATCGHCIAFDLQLDLPAFEDYLANRGLVMIYAKDNSTVLKWVLGVPGGTSLPVWRITWPEGGVDYRGSYPKTYAGFKAELEGQIGAYSPGSTTSPTGAPGRIEFASAAVTVKESAKNVVLTLKRTGGTAGSAKVTISTEDSSSGNGFTAKAGEDFNATPSPTTLTWANGDSAAKKVTITLAKTVVQWEGNETFGVKLTPDLVTLPGLTVGSDAVVTLQEVDAFATAAANYQGWVGALDDTGVLGTVSLSVSAAGGLSGKAVFPKAGTPYSGTYTLKNAAYQAISNGTAWIAGSFSKSGSTVPVALQISVDSGRVIGALGETTNSIPVELYRNDWSKSAWATVAGKFSGYYTVALPICCASWPDDAPMGSGYAAITLDKKGNYKVAGKLGDGTALSQSGVLFLHPDSTITNPVLCALLYSAPTTYAGGVFGGVICFGDQNTNGVIDVSMGYGDSLVWRSLDPFSVPSYDEANPGFESTVAAVGGWYNTTENLKSYYAGKTLFVDDLSEPPGLDYTLTTLDAEGTTRSDETALATSWQAVSNSLPVSVKANGSGFTVAAADLKLLGSGEDGEPLYNYDSAVNPNGLKLSFNRTTGLMSGTFNVYYDYVVKDDMRTDTEKLTWAHTQKTATYASILMLEQADQTSGLVSCGYYQFPESVTYETATGATRTYSLKRSYNFVISSDVSE